MLSQGRDAELTALLQRYKGDVSAVWAYSQALAFLRREGPSTRALRHLRAAIGSNRFVPEFLLGKRRLPRRLPEYVGLGDESEAVSYAAEFADTWQVAPGALAWLATHWDGPRA